jgi:DNA-binding winged helix-turn-helix (wHTH) protein
VRFGRCEVRIGCREILVDGHPRPLQPLPFNLLLYLIEHRNRIVTIDELLDAMWGDACVQQGSLPAAVMRVRKALGVDGGLADDVIRTYSRIGYRFVARVEGDPPAGEPPTA